MKVLIIGAGISGIMTAYFLKRAGCDVTVVDRESGAADSTSFANGGVMGCTQVDPWGQPGLPLKLLAWLGKENAPVLVRWRQIPSVLGWGTRFLARCNARDVQQAMAANMRLTLFSMEQFSDLRTREGMTGAEYDLGRKGAYKLFFTKADLHHARESAAALSALGAPVEVLDATTAADREAALGPLTDRLAGVMAFPEEETGDCRKFTRWLAYKLRFEGVQFQYETEVSGFRMEGGRIRAATSSAGDFEAEAYLVAQASHSPLLLRRLGVKVPIIPVKGVSVTVPAAPWQGALESAVMDHSRLFGLIRIGDRLRLSGSAEVIGYDTVPSRARCQALIDSVLEIFPQVADCLNAAPPLMWAGLRGNSPDGVPILGKTAISNLFLNAGHGPEGWSTACGAGNLVAAAMTDQTPAIDMAEFEQRRFH